MVVLLFLAETLSSLFEPLLVFGRLSLSPGYLRVYLIAAEHDAHVFLNKPCLALLLGRPVFLRKTILSCYFQDCMGVFLASRVLLSEMNSAELWLRQNCFTDETSMVLCKINKKYPIMNNLEFSVGPVGTGRSSSLVV